MRTDKIRQILRALYSYTFLVLLMEMFLLSTKRPHISWLGLLLMAAVFVGSYILRNLVRRIWPIILFTLITGAGIWFLPTDILDGMERVMLVGVTLGLMVTASRFVVRHGILSEPQEVPWPAFLLGIMATIFGYVYESDELKWIAAVLTGVALIFYLLILYADSTRKYIDSTKNVQGVPIRQITKMNTWIIVGVFLCMIVAILLGEVVHLPDAFVGFLSAMLSVLKIIFFGVALVLRWIGQLFGIGKRSDMEQTAQQLRHEASQQQTYTNILEFVLKGALLILVIFIIIKIIARVLRLLSASYHRTSTERVEEAVRTDIKTRIPHPSFFERVKESLSMEERARRIYRKRVLALRKDRAPEETETTADIEAKILAEAGVALPELTRLYNAVRYGSVPVDRAYLNRMKEADIRK